MRYESSFENASTKICAQRKNQRIDWTPEIHTRFVYATKKLGSKASPKKILALMNVDGLNRYHVASHFQRYRKALKDKNISFEKSIVINIEEMQNACDVNRVNVSHLFEFTTCGNKTSDTIVPFCGFCDVL